MSNAYENLHDFSASRWKKLQVNCRNNPGAGGVTVAWRVNLF